MRCRTGDHLRVVIVEDRDRFCGLARALVRIQRHFHTNTCKWQEHPTRRPPTERFLYKKTIDLELPDVG